MLRPYDGEGTHFSMCRDEIETENILQTRACIERVTTGYKRKSIRTCRVENENQIPNRTEK